jgi:hypothetical protein
MLAFNFQHIKHLILRGNCKSHNNNVLLTSPQSMKERYKDLTKTPFGFKD